MFDPAFWALESWLGNSGPFHSSRVSETLGAKRSKRVAPAFLFGLASGLALTVKPTFLLFCLLPVVDQVVSPEDRALFVRRCAAVIAGIACPFSI